MSVTYREEPIGDAILGRLRLERPEASNALDGSMVDALGEALVRASARCPDALLLEAAGRNFCGGSDLKEAGSLSSEQLLSRFLRVEAALEAVASFSCPTIALVTGWAVGAGADLVAACDFRIGVAEASFRFPGWSFGLALGTRRLTARVGSSVALDLLLTRRAMEASEALKCGLLTQVCTDGAEAMRSVGAVVAGSAEIGPAARIQLLRLTRPELDKADSGELSASILRQDLGTRMEAFRAGTLPG